MAGPSIGLPVASNPDSAPIERIKEEYLANFPQAHTSHRALIETALRLERAEVKALIDRCDSGDMGGGALMNKIRTRVGA